MINPPKDLATFTSLLQIVTDLRGPQGCPWDKEQTSRSLAPFAIEEAHELAEAIEVGVTDEIVGELGDLLLQVALHAEIGRQESRFTISDVLRAVNEKMVRRHPHVFSTTAVADSGEVLDNWAKIKDQEKAAKKQRHKQNQFEIPVSLPALSRAHKIGDKTKQTKFDWSTSAEVLMKVEEEFRELREALNASDLTAIEHELGDVLFSLAQLGRHLKIESEQALRTANQRFEQRYFTMQENVRNQGKDWAQLTDEEKQKAWEEAKLQLAKHASAKR